VAFHADSTLGQDLKKQACQAREGRLAAPLLGAIRNEADLERHIDYVHFNPVKHRHVTHVANWPHSSFHRYVERGVLVADWGGDIKDIPGSFGE
jgi:hypothetical protein